MSLLPPACNGGPAFYRAMHFSAKRGLAIACPCRLSVRPFVCDVCDLWSHMLEILETNCTGNQPSTFALCSHKAIYVLPGEHGEILGRLEVGYGKVAFWGTKAAISLKRVKIEEKLLWTAYWNSQTLFRTVPPPTPYGIPSCGHGQGQPQFLDTPINSGRGKVTDL